MFDKVKLHRLDWTVISWLCQIVTREIYNSSRIACKLKTISIKFSTEKLDWKEVQPMYQNKAFEIVN